MRSYICTICGYVYEEAEGIPEAGILPGTKWEDVPADWVCPVCGADKADFEQKGSPAAASAHSAAAAEPEVMHEMNALEMSALCSNLARGCDKQYKQDESALFAKLADFFKASAAPAEDANTGKLLALIENDLKEGLPAAHAASAKYRDRGAMRALVWNEKVTKILSSLLKRYEKEGEAMLENTKVYVCTMCGFVFVGDAAPALCPVCKVPSWKFEEIVGRAS